MNESQRMAIYQEAKLDPEQIKEIEDCLEGIGEDFYDTSAYEKLYEYFAFEACEMPYGTAKARDGDPDTWILERLS